MVEDRDLSTLVEDSDVIGQHLEARRDVDPGRLGMALPGQIHVVDAEGTVHNFVGPQTVPLTTVRDGGPYLDDVERAREQLRRDYTLKAPATVGITDAPVAMASDSVVKEKPEDVNSGEVDQNGNRVNPQDSPVEDHPVFDEEDSDNQAPVEPSDEELFGDLNDDDRNHSG